jgi:enoyl-CoA hydratase/carnithine racemase
MYQDITLDITKPVATITLNRPEKLNAATYRMLAEVRHAIDQAERNNNVIGIVITGAGRGFCAGMDMEALQQIQAQGTTAGLDYEGLSAHPGDRAMGDDFKRGLAYLLTVRKPIIAAVNGPVAGYGFSLMVFCDLRFAAESAVFTTSFAQRGLVAEHGQSWLLPRLIGPARALDVFWSGRKFDAAEALQLGIVNRVFANHKLLDETNAYLRGLAERCSPTSLMHMKQQVYRDLIAPLGEAMVDTEDRMAASNRWPDFQEGITSFMERRAPKFPPLRFD